MGVFLCLSFWEIYMKSEDKEMFAKRITRGDRFYFVAVREPDDFEKTAWVVEEHEAVLCRYEPYGGLIDVTGDDDVCYDYGRRQNDLFSGIAEAKRECSKRNAAFRRYRKKASPEGKKRTLAGFYDAWSRQKAGDDRTAYDFFVRFENIYRHTVFLELKEMGFRFRDTGGPGKGGVTLRELTEADLTPVRWQDESRSLLSGNVRKWAESEVIILLYRDRSVKVLGGYYCMKGIDRSVPRIDYAALINGKAHIDLHETGIVEKMGI